MLGGRRQRAHRGGDVLYRVATTAHQPGDALGPERGQDAGCPAAPVVARDQRPVYAQRVEQVERIVRNRRLLTRAHRVGRTETCGPKASKIRPYHAAAGRGEQLRSLVVGPHIVRKPVQEQHRVALRITRCLVGYVQRRAAGMAAQGIGHAAS